jgi:HlyD family secretion protein
MRTVWILRGDKPEPVSIRIGLTNGTLTEVVDGPLQEGEPLVVEAINNEEPPSAPTKSGGGASNPGMRFRL